MLETILGQHDYPAPVAALVAEAALITALIGQTIKLRWKLSLQIRGDGPVRLIATDYFGPAEEGQPARMRAYAGFDAAALPAEVARPFDLLGKGVFAILIDQGPGTAPYQGVTPIAGASLADCAETYFAQSEQLPTRFALAMGEAVEPGGAAHWRGGGVLLQHMPKASPYARAEATGPDGLLAAEDLARRRRRRQLAPGGDAARDRRGDRADRAACRRRAAAAAALQRREPAGLHGAAGALRLHLRAGEGGALAGDLSRRATSPAMTTPEGKVTADCQFCGAHYEFDPSELGSGADGPE